VSQTLTQLNKKNIGGELSLEYQLSQTFKTTFRRLLVNIPDSNQKVTLTNDAQASVNNTNPVLILVKLHSKITKQRCHNAYSLGLEYQDYWWISANVNYITNSYLDIAQFPELKFSIKIQQTVSIFQATEERAAELLKQENLIQYR
jgi:hypothetical protein